MPPWVSDPQRRIPRLQSWEDVNIPAELRRRLEIEPGDKLRWTTDGEGNLSVEIVHQREGVFDDFEAVDVGETNAVDAESEFGAE